MRECSSRITVQFLNEIDRNHESQIRKLLRNLKSILLLSIWRLINCTEKKIHVLQYMQYILYLA